MSQPMDPDDAKKLAKSCVCSDCWGELTVKYDWRERASTVNCQTPDCPQNGYVSRRYVEKRESASAGELAEARCALTRAGVIKSGKNEKQLLGELGF